MKAIASKDTHNRRIGTVAALSVTAIAACAVLVSALAQSSDDVLYSLGRVLAWLAEPLLILLVLAFPAGRLTWRWERRLVAASLALVAILYLPTMLLVESYPAPSPWSGCDAGCPPNAFMVLDSEPGWVGDVIVPLREAATVILFAGVVAVLAARIRRGTPLTRITLVPVLTVAILHALAIIAGIVTRGLLSDTGAAEVFALLIGLTFAGVGAGFVVGLWAWRLFENRALRRLAAGLASHPPALNLRETAELLSSSMDRSLEILYRPRDAPDGWVDMQGRPTILSANEELRCVTEISADDGRVVAMLHDVALKDDPPLLDVARSSVLKALEVERLSEALRSSLRELNDSRARIMSSADRERQRIERDLHDGAQQSLVALRIRLELAGDLLRESPARAERMLGELSADVDRTLEQVRSLARGVYPALLTDRGLGDALRSAATRTPVRTTFDGDGVGRYAPEVEVAVYFCCLEAIQNAMKHAAGVERIAVSVAVAVDGDLHFEVSDDGDGFAADEAASGTGIASMRDRLASIGGRLEIQTAPGMGTSVAGTVPAEFLAPANQNGNGHAPVVAVPSTSSQPGIGGQVV